MQIGSTAPALDFVVELVEVIPHAQQQELDLHLDAASKQKPPEAHVLLEHPESPLYLNGTVYA